MRNSDVFEDAISRRFVISQSLYIKYLGQLFLFTSGRRKTYILHTSNLADIQTVTNP
jgi:hypothetical protein